MRSPLLTFLFVSCVSTWHAAGGPPLSPQGAAPIHTATVEAKGRPSEQNWKPNETRYLDPLPADWKPAVALDSFGGFEPAPARATGFFHTQRIDGRWWLIDPAGGRFLSVGVCAVNSWGSPNGRENVDTKFGSLDQWMSQTTGMLKENGFNCTGAWSDTNLLRRTEPHLAYTQLLDFMASYGKKRGGAVQVAGHMGFPESCIFVFDPGFETYCDEEAAKLSKLKDDPWLIGYFSDNELPFEPDELDRYLKLAENEPGHAFAKDWLGKHGGEITPQNRTDFLTEVVDRYFRITTSAIRKYDRNHLCLGSRFYGKNRENATVWTAAGKHLDVVSINYYGAWTPSVDLMTKWLNWAQKPFLVTEFYVKGMDSGLGNTSGAGWCVKTQHDRGLFYQNFALSLLEAPGCVGWQWFKYADNDPANTKADPSNLDSNKGIVSSRHEPYQPLLSAMRDFNLRVYSLPQKK